MQEYNGVSYRIPVLPEFLQYIYVRVSNTKSSRSLSFISVVWTMDTLNVRMPCEA